ncbi:MAG: hypothetical protein A2018_03915 [Alphaproteobacteria bacterium GWF2_58_20]|nr:MAG: hypothetical protein A2018_03915 [Alphaproteobacteria bacterium GWF2_58_20]
MIASIHKRHGQKLLSLVCLLPLLGSVAEGLMGQLGARPWFRAMGEMGEIALAMLIACLAITPLVQAFDWKFLYPWRRTFGLFAFFYAILHVLARAMDLGLDLGAIMEGMFTNPFLLTGFLAFLVMVPLAVTSTKKMMATLGGKRWRLLHKLTYVAAILAIAHALMAGKAGYINFLPQAVILAILLLWRLVYPTLRKAMQKPQG